MTNINDMHGKEDYVAAYKQERFTDYVTQRKADTLLRRRVLAVFLAAIFICAIATLALSYKLHNTASEAYQVFQRTP